MWTETFEEKHALGLEPLSDGKCVTKYYYYTNERECDGGYEYDVYEFEAGASERSVKIKLIEEYDKSDAVNSFYLNGKQMWLPLEERKSMRQSLIALKAVGVAEFTYWLGVTPITMAVEQFEKILNAIEVYALRCFNMTAQHKAAVMAMTSNEEIVAYDYKGGYPDKLSF